MTKIQWRYVSKDNWIKTPIANSERQYKRQRNSLNVNQFEYPILIEFQVIIKKQEMLKTVCISSVFKTKKSCIHGHRINL